MRTAFGATAVQIAEYAQGRHRIVKHLGSAHTEAELGLLLEHARVLLGDADQDERALGVTPTPRPTGLVTTPVDDESLFPVESGPTPGDAALSRVSAGRVLGNSSRLMYDVLCGVYDDLGFAAVGDEVFRDLVISRIVEPTSILDTPRVLSDLGREPASASTLRRTLRRAHTGRVRAAQDPPGDPG